MSRLAREGRPDGLMMPDGGYTLFVVCLVCWYASMMITGKNDKYMMLYYIYFKEVKVDFRFS